MPTQITPIGDASVFVRFKEPYVSDGLNKKLRGLVGSGVVRGGKLVTTGAGFNVTIVADVGSGDSVYSYSDVGERQFTVRQAGNVNLNLAPFAGTTVYVALYVGYTLGVTTVCEWRAYTEAELFTGPLVAEAAFVVVLGRVAVPGVAPVLASNITPRNRRMAWDDAPPARWYQIIENGDFEQSVGSGASGAYGIAGWLGQASGNPTFEISVAAPYDGTREFSLDQTVLAAVSERLLTQLKRVRVAAGMYVRARVRLRGALWTTPTHQGVALVFYDSAMQVIAPTVWIEDTTLTGTFAYTLIDQTIVVPTNAVWMRASVGVDNGGVALAAGDLFFDDCKVWVESEHPIEDSFDGEMLSMGGLMEQLSLAPLGTPVTSMAEYVARTLIQHVGSQASAIEQVTSQFRGSGPWLWNLLNGALKLGVGGSPDVPRIVTPVLAADPRTLLWESDNGTDPEKLRIYFVTTEVQNSGNVGIEITVNARWDDATSLWQADDSAGAAEVCSRFVILPSGFFFQQMNMASSVAAGWEDGISPAPVDVPRQWDYAMLQLGGGGMNAVPSGLGNFATGRGFLVLEDGAINFRNAGSPSGSNPGSATNISSNAIYAKSLIKAWIRFSTGGALSKNDAIGVNSLVANGDSVDVNLLSGAEIDGIMGILVSLNDASDSWIVTALPVTSTQFLVSVYDETGAQIDLNALTTEVMAVVIGRQDG